MKDRTEFLGLAFDPLAQSQVVEWLRSRTANSPFAYITTPNVDHMVRISRDTNGLVTAYEQADLVLCDSRVLAQLARSMGLDLPVVTGSDLTRIMFNELLNAGDMICLIGGAEGDDARLEARFSGIKVIQHCPPLGLRFNKQAQLEAAKKALSYPARFTLLGVGSPQQELIAQLMAEQPGACGTALCVGASVDFILGVQIRAPRFLQKLGLEWAWRLANNPMRLGPRYLIDGPAIFPIAWAWKRQQKQRKAQKKKQAPVSP